MSENVELTVKPIIITQDCWKNTAGCQQTFWSRDNRLSPDLKLCWQPVVTRHFLSFFHLYIYNEKPSFFNTIVWAYNIAMS